MVAKQYGLSCDNLVSAEVVTADGDFLTANADENADLFWGLRGGGGNFGVVTSFEFALHPVGPLIAAVFSFYPIAATRDVLKRWREWVASAPDEASTEIVTWTAPASASLPSAVHDQAVVIAAGVYAGDSQEGLRVLQQLRQLVEPLGEIAGAIPYRIVQSAFDASLPNTGEVLAYWKSLYLSDLTDGAIDIMANRAQNRSSRSTMVFVQHLGGAVRRGLPNDTAFPTRDAAYVMNFMGDWRNPRETPRHVACVRDAWNRLAPVLTGTVYLNYVGQEEKDADALVRSASGSITVGSHRSRRNTTRRTSSGSTRTSSLRWPTNPIGPPRTLLRLEHAGKSGPSRDSKPSAFCCLRPRPGLADASRHFAKAWRSV
jgi:hypothetical protein